MKVLIVEGVDLVGKSTAIEKIAKRFKNGMTIKNNYKPDSSDNGKIYLQYNAIVTMIKDYSYWIDDSLIILDRFYPSQLVYSYLRGFDEMNTSNKITKHRIQNVEAQLKELDVYVLLLDTSEEELKIRFINRGDEHVDIDQILELRKRYHQYFDICPFKKLKIDSMDKNFLIEVEKLLC